MLSAARDPHLLPAQGPQQEGTEGMSHIGAFIGWAVVINVYLFLLHIHAV